MRRSETPVLAGPSLEFLPLQKLGAIEKDRTIQFGIFLPNIADDYTVTVNLITEHDKPRQIIPPFQAKLAHSIDPRYGDYWTGEIKVSSNDRHDPLSPYGEDGTYLYWYTVESPATPISPARKADYIIDPFAREFGFSDCSAITVGYKTRSWSQAESAWKVPALKDLIVYEIQLNEFGGNIETAIEMLHYLKDLGVNAVEVMPVTNCATTIDWGYDPIGYFGVDNRFGNRAAFQQFVNQAHEHGIAVILDMVYGHTSTRFAYITLYDQLGMANPIMSPKGEFGPTPRLNVPLMGDLFRTVNRHWLDAYHVDGIRYDNVNRDWYDKESGGNYYGELTKFTYEYVGTKIDEPFWSRFEPETRSDANHLIQCAEFLEDPVGVLAKTYTNCAWQNDTLTAASNVAHALPIDALGLQSGEFGYPDSMAINGVTMPKAAFQYIENHDHPRFICNYGTHCTDKAYSRVLMEGDRDAGFDIDGHAHDAHWFQVQPYLIMLLTGKGVPLLWEGQEVCENYFMFEDWKENSRVRMFRPVRWDKSDDEAGRTLTDLVRRLTAIRRGGDQFRKGDHLFYNAPDYKNKGVLAFSRWIQGGAFSLVTLNFSGDRQTIPFVFPKEGMCREELQNGHPFPVSPTEGSYLTVPSNYGCIWTV